MFWDNSCTFYNVCQALGSFGFLPLRAASTGFAGVLPLPLIFDPPLYILHLTIYTTFQGEATLTIALELQGYSVKIRSRVKTITRVFSLEINHRGVSNSQWGRSCEQIFDTSIFGSKNRRHACNTNLINLIIWQLTKSCLRLGYGSAWKRSHQWCVSLTLDNAKTIGRMTCHCRAKYYRLVVRVCEFGLVINIYTENSLDISTPSITL